MLRCPTRTLPVIVAAMLVVACAGDSRMPSAPDESGGVLAAKGSGSGGGGGATGTGSVQIVQGGLGHGTITSSPAGINCTVGTAGASACSANFPAGTRVKLEARAASNSKFEGWALTTSCQKAPTVEVKAGAVHSCQPVFSLLQPSTFLLQISNVGSGNTTSSPAGINCTSDADAGTLTGTCAANYSPNTVVTLTATAAAGWRFSGWSGDSDCSDAKVTMSAARRCTATFTRL